MKLFLASHNQGKLRELRALLAPLPLEIESWRGALPAEAGETLEANARVKARTVAAATGAAALGDDSGLEVDALGGAPGVRSARYAGDEGDPARNIVRLLDALRGVPPERRGARFRCALCLVAPGRREILIEGQCRGTILEAPRGGGGFGYDPVFFVREVGRAMAEMTQGEKNVVSHRGRAVRALRAELEKWWPCT